MVAIINSQPNNLYITQQVWAVIQNRRSLFPTDLFICGLFNGSFNNPDNAVLTDRINTEYRSGKHVERRPRGMSVVTSYTYIWGRRVEQQKSYEVSCLRTEN
jgi:hypothetical protein